jgi:hypothetical protein
MAQGGFGFMNLRQRKHWCFWATVYSMNRFARATAGRTRAKSATAGAPM